MSRTVGIVIAIILVVGVIGVAAIVFAAGAILNFAWGGVRGSGNIITESREPGGDFDQISVCCGMQLQFKQGDTSKLEIEGDDNIVPEIETRVDGDRLVVEYRSRTTNHRPSQPVRVYAIMPAIRGVHLSGGSSLDTSILHTDRFELSTSGGSSARIDSLTTQTLDLSANGGGHTGINSLNAQALDVSTNGGGDTRIGSGVIGEQSVKINGGGSYSAADLESQTATLDLNGGSEAIVWVVESMDIKASGGSTVTYYGSPRISQSTSGGSRIESMGDR